MQIDPTTHPIELISKLGNEWGWDLTLQFSRYFYRPQSVLDERDLFEVPLIDVTVDWLGEQIDSLRPGWELALNSKAIDGRGRSRHIGMIDFIGRPNKDLVARQIRNLLGSSAAKQSSFYDSGRSIHAYVLDLMGPKQWHEFLGRLLLMNMPQEESLVDARWIGHRLIGGYSALRWSWNSPNYLKAPSRLEAW